MRSRSFVQIFLGLHILIVFEHNGTALDKVSSGVLDGSAIKDDRQN